MPSKNIHRVTAIAAVATVVYSAVDFFKFRQQEVQKRKEIQDNTVKDIAAIWYACGRVQEKIAHGDYKNYDDARVDQKFFEQEFHLTKK